MKKEQKIIIASIIVFVIILLFAGIKLIRYMLVAYTPGFSGDVVWPLEAEAIVFKEEDSAYVIDVNYPELSNDRFDINLKIKEIVSSTIQTFKNDVKQYGSDLGVVEGQKSGLYITFVQPSFNDGNVFSFYFVVSPYMAGAAHPNKYVIPFNYNVHTGEKITLESLFNQKTDYLKKLSDFSITDLTKQAQAQNSYQVSQDLIKNGAAPKKENFENFVLHPPELIVLFNPYQVGAYAEGIKKVSIPLSELKEVLR
jgi:hypothetical protein